MKSFKIINIRSNIRLYQDLQRFAFEIGYSFEKMEEDSHLMWLTIGFWQIDFAWKPMSIIMQITISARNAWKKR